jgi:L-threonylcarbamoyladenylate synthase
LCRAGCRFIVLSVTGAGAEVAQVTEPAARAQAAEALAAGEIVVLPFNGIFVLAGDADDPAVTEKIAIVKQRPLSKSAALVCPPEFLGEHVAVDGPSRTSFTLRQVQALYQAVHAIGVILRAARPGAPQHLVQAGTVLNVWTEQRPASPLRDLVLKLRRRERRALAGTSANLSGRPTITDPAEVASVFGGRVPLILLDTFEGVPPRRRRSASMVDLTAPVPRLVREGSVAAAELRAELNRLELGELSVSPCVPRV